MAGATVYPTISLLIPLTFFIRLYRTLDANLEQAVEKFTIKTPNLTAEETEFLHKVVNYDTEVNLKYLILNKTQDMYTQNYEKLYKQAEDQMAYNDDHLKDYRKYKYYFDTFHDFKRLYYDLHNRFFARISRHVKQALVASFRAGRDDSVDDFLAKEALIDSRTSKIFSTVDDVLLVHYAHVDEMASRKFFSNFRYFYDERLYKKLRYEFDYHIGHEFFKSAAKNT